MNSCLTVALFLHGFCRVPQLHWEVHFLFAVLHGQPTRILPDFVEHVDLQQHDSSSCKRPDMKNQWKEKNRKLKSIGNVRLTSSTAPVSS